MIWKKKGYLEIAVYRYTGEKLNLLISIMV